MAQITYRANLSAKSFPFISNNWGQSVIVPGPDNTFNRQLSASEDSDRDVGIPQMYYCHNLIPNAQGFQSIGYNTISNGVAGKVFISQFFIRDGEDNKLTVGITTAGEVYVNSGSSWTYKTTFTGTYQDISVAYVSGKTYIWIPKLGCFVYNFTTNVFDSVILTGLDVNKILGICPSFGYLIAWDSSSIAWSSVIDATDFTPDLVTGAGGGQVEGTKGIITFCLQHTLGFIVYTARNTVAALYSGNSRYPFNFREIVNSGGCSSRELVSWDSNTGNHYAYTTSGLQLISTSQTQTIFPEVTDFISGRVFEDFEETTQVFTRVYLSITMQKKLTVISDRYLILSYGITSLTHAIVYDLAQKRWGKFKISHIDCFEFELANPGVFELPKQSIAFLQSDGTIKIVDFSQNNINGAGVIILGKYQYVRSRTLQLNAIFIENSYNTNFHCKVLSTIDGKNGSWSDYTLVASGDLRSFYGRAIGENHSVLFYGDFYLDSMELNFSLHGKR